MAHEASLAFAGGDDELIVEMSARAGRPINFNAIVRVDESTIAGIERALSVADVAKARGARVFGIQLPVPQRTRLSFAVGSIIRNLPVWHELFEMPLLDRQLALAEETTRLELAGGLARGGAMARALSDWSPMVVREVGSSQFEDLVGRTIGSIAGERDVDPFTTILDIAVADGLQTGFERPALDESDADWAARMRLVCDPRTVVGGSDAGAHADLFCNSNIFTGLLQHGVRERRLLSLEEAVRQLTDVPARAFGVRERGRLEPGWHADVTVFDPETVAYTPWRTVRDLPGGASRLYSEGTGIALVLVNGVPVVEHGRSTGSCPGRVLKSGRDTESLDTGRPTRP
jgi:N-acyl-D-aspartate/D-glutamate deacylase